jgi:ADP-ribose pyrophosphatase YjhB (NUDIX family)
MQYERPDLFVDIVLMTMIDGRLQVALYPREKEPDAGKWCLVGGQIHTNEDADITAAALRTLRTKLDFEPRYIEQVATEGGATRDPRRWSATVVHLALNSPEVLAELVESRGMKLFDVEDDGAHLPADMALDHRKLTMMAVERLRNKAAYSTIVAHFLPEEFPLNDLRLVYEAVRQKACNAANFRTKIMKENVLDELDSTLFSGGRPASAFRLKQDIAYFARELY